MNDSKVAHALSNGQALALPDLAEQINAEYERYLGALNNAIEHARETGRLLYEARQQLPHGQFQAWVAKHCSFWVEPPETTCGCSPTAERSRQNDSALPF